MVRGSANRSDSGLHAYIPTYMLIHASIHTNTQNETPNIPVHQHHVKVRGGEAQEAQHENHGDLGQERLARPRLPLARLCFFWGALDVVVCFGGVG